jgi:hypothetical protein
VIATALVALAALAAAQTGAAPPGGPAQKAPPPSATAAKATPAPAAPDLAPRPPAGKPGETRCVRCHVAEGWRQVSFSHERTGFPLTGRHRDVVCAACHPQSDYARPVPRACAACHRDVHAQRLGQRCDRCHGTASWKEATFGPDAHRRTAFPLTGRHAALPCEECHGDRRDRVFSRPTVACAGCHEADWQRTAAAGLDHQAAGFGTDCRGCHGTFRFSPATWPAHDACFAIRAGPHAGIACLDCHTTIPPIVAGQPLQCSSGTADCIRCHGTTHPPVPGYQPSNQRCYECHRFAAPLPRFQGKLR